MKIEKNLDKIIDILYSEEDLHWKQVPVTDIMVYGRQKHNINWTDVEINFILKILQDEGYVKINSTTPDSMQMPTYSITPKGVLMKRNGGFKKSRKRQRLISAVLIS